MCMDNQHSKEIAIKWRKTTGTPIVIKLFNVFLEELFKKTLLHVNKDCISRLFSVQGLDPNVSDEAIHRNSPNRL